jgi:hypothetical protein
MRNLVRAWAAFALLVIPLLPRPAAAVPWNFLEAIFDDEPLDEPIGTGGYGQPVDVEGIGAIVHEGFNGTPALFLTDESTDTGAVTFEVPEGASIAYGALSIDFEILLDSYQPFAVEIREPFPGTSQNYLTLIATDAGVIQYTTNLEPIPTAIGDYAPNVPLQIHMGVTPAGGSVSVALDNALVLHTFNVVGTGVGSFRFVLQGDPDLAGALQLDDLVGVVFDENVDAPEVASSGSGLTVAPNPFSAATALSLAAPGLSAWQVDIYDVSGRAVRRLEPEPRSTTVRWDGRTSAGGDAPPGVYFARVRSAAGSSLARLVRVK